jgi:exo-beta-1,3-glucanase (GH17 family)
MTRDRLLVVALGFWLFLSSGVPENVWSAERKNAPVQPLLLFVEETVGVNYGPYHYDGQSPDDTVCVPDEQIISDLGKISRANFTFLRIYGLDNCLNNIVPLAKTHQPQLKIFIGVYVSGVDHDNSSNPHRTRWQLNEAIRLANNYDNVAGVVVGNECLAGDGGGQSNPVSVDQLIADLDYVAGSLLPERRPAVRVTTAMAWGAAVGNYAGIGSRIKDHCDIIMVNVFPFWAGAPTLEQACSNFNWACGEVATSYRSTGKPIAVGETGWPSQGSCVTGPLGTACPGLEREKAYMECAVNYTRQLGMTVFLFEMFDEPWKIGEGTFGPHWGLYDKNGNPKFP